MRYYGNVGYAIPSETGLDIIEDTIIERSYYGDVLKNNRRWEKGEGVNDNLNISNRISIVAYPIYRGCLEWTDSILVMCSLS